MEIRLVGTDEIDKVISIYYDCKSALENESIFQWTSNYPNSTIVANDITHRNLYGIFKDTECLGVVCIDGAQPIEYQTVPWESLDDAVLVIHRLAIKPGLQKQGLANQLMDFCENNAIQNGAAVIRLDAYSANKRACDLYIKRSYKNMGKVYFTGRDLPFLCFEKRL